jgi:MFS family permease
VNLVAASFAWPFRGDWRPRWLVGLVMVVLLPIAFIPLLGYAIAATRSASKDPDGGLPPWSLSHRLLADGFWVAVAIALIAAPFALALGPLSSLVERAHLWQVSDPSLSKVYAELAALSILALPWGLVMLLLMPYATNRFALSGRPADLFDFPTALRSVSRDFATWNLAAAAIVTAWALGVASVGLLCVGIVPGIFYAILVSAHATAALSSAPATPV